jgi:hypothetical protein
MGIQAKLVLWLLSLAAVLGALYGVYLYGRHVEGLERDRQRLERAEYGIEAGNKLAGKDGAAAADAAVKNAARAASAGARTGRVERGIAAHADYTACALSAQDMQELNDAVEGR